ncbi:hypothetical protein DYQ86_00195 [Acidobacteria bacterium AB60]|nr:hypothetical protein DYQ86_00195 [Acidobacteria bacterium AB60]
MSWSSPRFLQRSVVQKGVDYIKDACALPSCKKKRMFSNIVRDPRIKRSGSWFCSGDCLAQALLSRLTALPDARLSAVARPPRYSVGLILLSQRRLTQQQLRTAMDHASKSGESVEDALVDLGLASEEQITAARAAQWGFPVFNRTSVAEPVESMIPRTLLRTYGAVPLHHSPSSARLLLGFVFRVGHSLLSSIEQVTGNKVEACFITPSEMQRQIERNRDSEFEEVVFGERLTPREIAETVQRMAESFTPIEASFADCGYFFWTRLIGKRRKIDLLFRMDDAVEAFNNC